MKRVLLIAYHYPPVHVSSGIQRTLKFSQYLPEFGWEPLVLTVHPRAYASLSEGQLSEIPEGLVVRRAFGLDTARHLSIAGKYLDWMALPDRWASWWLGGVWDGLRLIRRYRVDAIVSTYPIATAHAIGLTLHKLTGVPWVADFRDSMTEDKYPREMRRRKVFRWLEKKTVANSARSVFTTPGAVRMYRERYPELSPEKWVMIPNGFDEENFSNAEQALANLRLPDHRPVTLVHSGVLYPSERDPRCFFDAIAALKQNGAIQAGRLQIVLRATGHDHLYRPMLAERDIADIVSLEPSMPYADALQEMLTSDGLLIFQAANCNHQVPAKIYEYFRAGKPILALTDAAGDTAGVLRDASVGTTVPLDDAEAIQRVLMEFIGQLETGKAIAADASIWRRHSRQARSEALAQVLDQVTG